MTAKNDWCYSADNGESLICERCGQPERVSLPMNLTLYTTLLTAFCKVHGRCKPSDKPPAPVIDHSAPISVRASRWLEGRDTGSSSTTICKVMQGFSASGPWAGSEPADPSDFGRCHRLLELIPEWRPRLSEVADRYPLWRGLVDNWDELTALYVEELPSGKAPKCYARMRDLIEAARKAGGRP